MYLLLIISVLLQIVYPSKIADKCKSCRDIVKNFHKGMEKTGKNHFGGGDTAWEESRLGSYARSETRLLEILENICEEASKEGQCHALVEEHEEKLESFWFNKHNELSQLEEYFCMNELKVCCIEGKYGKDCKDCPGGSDNPCLGKGKCKGSGTRGGSGKCECDGEYQGEKCDECAEDHYDVGNNTCAKCDESCELSCSDATSKGCDSCKEGYVDDEEQGCIDKDECKDDDICKEGTYCFNTKGSFRCHDCDPACDGGCTNSGRLSCTTCKPGWKLRDEGQGCDDIDECKSSPDLCSVGTYCKNNDGSHTCERCNIACANGCSGEGTNTCVECAPGFKMEDGVCVDVDECSENNIQCSSGQVCVNKVGPDGCEACHFSCIECTNTTPESCLQCKPGYMLDDGKCNDVDECKSNPCNAETENCSNTSGSYKCRCKKGWARTKNGDCVKSTKKGNNGLKERSEKNQHFMDQDEFRRDMDDGKYLTENHLRFGSLLYTILFALLLYLFKKGRYYAIAIVVFVYGVVIAFINSKYRRPDLEL